jgi:hypothetical protein
MNFEQVSFLQKVIVNFFKYLKIHKASKIIFIFEYII